MEQKWPLDEPHVSVDIQRAMQDVWHSLEIFFQRPSDNPRVVEERIAACSSVLERCGFDELPEITKLYVLMYMHLPDRGKKTLFRQLIEMPNTEPLTFFLLHIQLLPIAWDRIPELYNWIERPKWLRTMIL